MRSNVWTTRSLFVAMVMGTAPTACGPPNSTLLPASTAGPVMTILDSFDLEETDSNFIAVPLHLNVMENGDILTSDRPTSRIFLYDRNGAFKKTFSSRGRGPGQIMWMTCLLPIGDSLLFVGDDNLHRITYFDLRTGDVIKTVPYQGHFNNAAVKGDSIYLGLLRSTKESGFTGLAVTPLLGDSIYYSQGVPPIYAERNYVQGTKGNVLLSEVGSTVAFSFAALPNLYLLERSGTVDTVTLPSARRLPAPADPMEAFSERALMRLTPAERVRITSLIWSVSSLPNGRFAVIFADLKRATRAPDVSVTWLTIVDSSFTRACVDGAIPIDGHGYVRFDFVGDTLNVLDQVVTETALRTRLRRFLPDLSACDWVPLDRRRGAPLSPSTHAD